MEVADTIEVWDHPAMNQYGFDELVHKVRGLERKVEHLERERRMRHESEMKLVRALFDYLTPPEEPTEIQVRSPPRAPRPTQRSIPRSPPRSPQRSPHRTPRRPSHPPSHRLTNRSPHRSSHRSVSHVTRHGRMKSPVRAPLGRDVKTELNDTFENVALNMVIDHHGDRDHDVKVEKQEELRCASSRSGSHESEVHIISVKVKTEPSGDRTRDEDPICARCKKTFATHADVLSHYSTAHPRELLLSCSKCEAQLDGQEAFDEHKKVPHNCKCLDCPMSFVFHWNLFRHHNDVHDGRPYACVECHRRFMRKVHVERHVQRIHKKKKSMKK